MKGKLIALTASVMLAAATFGGCAKAADKKAENLHEGQNNEIYEELPAEEQLPEIPEIGEIPEIPEEEERPEIPAVAVPEPQPEPPKAKTVSYILVNADGVNIRSGAGTGYSSLGTAEKSTLYALLGEENGWYKTNYKNKNAYISKKYCTVTEMQKSDDEKIEAVISEGTKLLGTPYVYGATRLHDGKGNLYKSFTVNAFDCSSLMQYMFYKGADKLLDVNTRTQIYQGTTVAKSKLQRGDLIFFTNASRKNNKGIERVGHVAMYLGDNYILHTASDYAKIEQISTTRWSYYIQTQRMI